VIFDSRPDAVRGPRRAPRGASPAVRRPARGVPCRKATGTRRPSAARRPAPAAPVANRSAAGAERPPAAPEVPNRTTVAPLRIMVRLVHLMIPNRTIVSRAGFRCAISALYSPQPHEKRPFVGGCAVEAQRPARPTAGARLAADRGPPFRLRWGVSTPRRPTAVEKRHPRAAGATRRVSGRFPTATEPSRPSPVDAGLPTPADRRSAAPARRPARPPTSACSAAPPPGSAASAPAYPADRERSARCPAAAPSSRRRCPGSDG